MGKLYKSFILLAGISLLLAGCAKEESLTSAELGGEQTTVTFTASMDDGTVTKAQADGDGTAASVNRCIMEIYYGDALFTRLYSKVNSNVASFSTQLVANRTYTVAFWADCVNDPDNGIETDLYYTTTEGKGLKEISINGDYAGNNDARDAFAFSDKFTVAQGGSTFNATLKRPFAQINVITTDVATVKTVADLKPENVTLTIKNAVTGYNVLDSTAVSGATGSLSYTASVYNWDDTKSECTLSMDYIFAEKTKGVIDIDWKAIKDNNADVSHTFSNIPYQRNYRTNIKGALLTTTGEWNVTLDPNWTNNGTGEFEVIVLVANTIADAQHLINSYAGDNSVQKTVEIQVKEEISDVQELCIPDNTTTPNWVFKIENMTNSGQIVVKDKNPGDDGVNYKFSAEVALPAGTTSSQTTFNTPNAHGMVSGTFGRIDATTSTSTLEVKADATVNEIYVHQGNVALYGTVTSIYRGTNNTADVIVNVYDGAVWTNWESQKASTGIKPTVNLGTYTFDPTGYNVAGSTVFDNGNQTWTVSVTDEWQYFAAKEFSNVSGTTITIMNAAELALFAKNVNEDVNYTGYTIKLGTDINLYDHEWTPIMLDEDLTQNMTFDGAGRTITALRINNRQESYSALFGTYFSHGTVIKDIVLQRPIVSQKQDPTQTAQEVGLNYTAALVAHMGCGVIDNCSVIDGTINGQDQVGAIVGYLACGDVKNCTVELCMVDAEVGRAGGLVGKANTDSEYEISNNTVRRTSVSAGQKFDGMLSAAALVGQIMTDSGNTWYIKDNTIENVQTATDEDNTFVPVGEFRKGYFNADAFTGGHIVSNTWDKACADTDRYVMVNPANTSESVTIWNGSAPDNWQWFAASSFSTVDKTNKTITITSPEELALFSRKLNSGTMYSGYKFLISQDLDMSEHYWQPVSFWHPGENTFDYLDGQNHTISNIKVADQTSDYIGFFGSATSLTVKNLTLDGVDLSYPASAGWGARGAALVGLAYGCVLTNCHAKNVSIKASQKVGGLIGFLDLDINTEKSVTDCSVENVTIQCNFDEKLGQTGGLIGHIQFDGSTHIVTVSGCSAKNITIKDYPEEYDYQCVPHAFIGSIVTNTTSDVTASETCCSAVLTNNTISGENTVLPTYDYSSTYFGWGGNAVERPAWKGAIYIDGTKWEPAQ